MKYKSPVFVAVVLVFLTGCVNLKNIQDYSAQSLKSLKNYDEIGYSFSKACLDRCMLEQIKNLTLTTKECDCLSNKKADSVTFLVFSSVKKYFEGLNKISANEVVSYKIDPISTSLKGGDFGDLQLDDKDIDSYTKISGVLLKAFTDTYRKKRIKNYIEDANAPLQVLLEALILNLKNNLNGKLKVQKQRIESVYFDFLSERQASAYEKRKTIEDYFSAITDINVKQAKILTFSQGLASIAEGHQQLYENRNRLTSAQLRDMISEYAGQINALIEQFEQL